MNYTATAAYPYEHLDRATAGLRAALRHQLLAAGVRGLQVWDTFVVTGPTTAKDPPAATPGFEWVGTATPEPATTTAGLGAGPEAHKVLSPESSCRRLLDLPAREEMQFALKASPLRAKILRPGTAAGRPW